MARQTFEVGQKVMVMNEPAWGGSLNRWAEATVTVPDELDHAYSGMYGSSQRETHYVRYAQTAAHSGRTVERRVINSRSYILSLEEYAPVREALLAAEEARNRGRLKEDAAIRRDYLALAYTVQNMVRAGVGAAALADYLQQHVSRPRGMGGEAAEAALDAQEDESE